MRTPMKTSTTIKSLVVILGFCLPGAACYRADSRAVNTEATRPRGATVSEVKNRYREPYMQLRMRLAEIARALPPMGSVRNRIGAADSRGRLANVNPLPTSENTGFIAAEQLLDPSRRLDFFELGTTGCPAQCFRWLADATAANSTNADREDRNGEMAREFEAGLARRYLIVYRATRYVSPQVSVTDDPTGSGSLGSSRYTPGSVDLEILIVNLQSTAVVDSFRVSAATPNEVQFTTLNNLNARAREMQMLGTVGRRLRENARENVFAGLTERTGRTFNPPGNPVSN